MPIAPTKGGIIIGIRITERSIFRPGVPIACQEICEWKANDARHYRDHYTDIETVDNQFPDIRIGHHQFEIGKREPIFNPERLFEDIEKRIYKGKTRKNRVVNPSTSVIEGVKSYLRLICVH